MLHVLLWICHGEFVIFVQKYQIFKGKKGHNFTFCTSISHSVQGHMSFKHTWVILINHRNIEIINEQHIWVIKLSQKSLHLAQFYLYLWRTLGTNSTIIYCAPTIYIYWLYVLEDRKNLLFKLHKF